MSLLRAEDYLYDHPKHVPNIYWSELIKTIDQFDQLLQIEKREISGFLKQKISKKIQLIEKYSQFKQNIKFLGESIKKESIIIDKQKAEIFFSGYSKQIRYIIRYLLQDPKKFAQYVSSYKNYKKYNFLDFCQNIPILIYPFYLPTNSKKISNSLLFIEQIINLWIYSIEYARPKFHSIIDDIIYGFFKIPPIICYVEKISAKFLKQLSNCRMAIFAFDEDAIKNQLQIKKHVSSITPNRPENKSIFSRVRGFLKRNKDDQTGLQTNSEILIGNDSLSSTDSEKSESQYSDIPEMMKNRQSSFVQLIKNTVQSILNEEVPAILKLLMKFFQNKLQAELLKNKKPKTIELKHYCYFLLTNFICAELHNKFTIAHEDTGMTNADLQNISEIIRILSSIFQGQDPELKRYKNIAHTLNEYKKQVEKFYDNILTLNTQQESKSQEMRQILFDYYENNILLSFNDIKILVDIYHEVKSRQSNVVDQKLEFLTQPQVNSLFDPNKNVYFQHKQFIPQNLIFIEDWSSLTSKQIVEFFVASEEPLEYLPMLKDIFFFSSNLTVEQSLEVTQDLKLIKKMPLKDIKQYLVKTANKFRHLNIKDFHTVETAFKDSLKNCLRNSLTRKQYLLYYRSQILYSIQNQISLINYYINDLRSYEFYEKISDSFLQNIKIKAYVNIQNNLLKVHRDAKDLKGLGVSNLMLANDKTTKNNDDYMLRHSFKSFETVKQLFRCIGKNQITKSALMTGRKVTEFNQIFLKAINIVISYVGQFLKKKSILKNLTKQKLESFIMKKLQNMIYVRYSLTDKVFQDDKKLAQTSELIDKQKFFSLQIANLNIERQFLLQQGKQKFKIMIDQVNVRDKVEHLQQLFKVIFTILGFTMAKGKITTDIIAPILQFIILECADMGHFKCLYSLECLNTASANEIGYLIVSYRSALIYIKQTMAQHFPKGQIQSNVKNLK